MGCRSCEVPADRSGEARLAHDFAGALVVHVEEFVDLGDAG
jgi:hypothetical protein